VRDGEILEKRLPIDKNGHAPLTEAEIVESEGEFYDDWNTLTSDIGAFVMFRDGGKAMPDTAFYANSRTG